jgi:hypothetical protein
MGRVFWMVTQESMSWWLSTVVNLGFQRAGHVAALSSLKCLPNVST